MRAPVCRLDESTRVEEERPQRSRFWYHARKAGRRKRHSDFYRAQRWIAESAQSGSAAGTIVGTEISGRGAKAGSYRLWQVLHSTVRSRMCFFPRKPENSTRSGVCVGGQVGSIVGDTGAAP